MILLNGILNLLVSKQIAMTIKVKEMLYWKQLSGTLSLCLQTRGDDKS